MPYQCADVVVIGKVQSIAYDPIPDGDDILGHGRITAKIKLRKIVKGPSLPRSINAHYVAHSYMRDDRDFMLILQREGDGSFRIRASQLMRLRPLLSPKCE